MASSLALKKLVVLNLIPTSLRAIRPTAITSKFFNTNVAHHLDDDNDIKEAAVPFGEKKKGRDGQLQQIPRSSTLLIANTSIINNKNIEN